MSHYKPLSTLDNNVMFKNSKNPKRLSMINKRQSVIGPPRLTASGSSVPRKHDSATPPVVKATRKSMAPARSKPNKVPIYNPIVDNGSQNTQLTMTAVVKDPRPLRDRKYQEQMRQEVYSFLNERGFEMDTKHLLTEKTLRSPTQKDFVVIFNWLFAQIDPGHVFTRSLESDVVTLLKIVQYPYLATINKSQISAVGGHNWHVFLGMLHWLVKCSFYTQQAENEVSKEDAEVTVASVEELDPAEKLNNMFFKYIKNAYKMFSMDKDDYESLKQNLQSEFNSYMALIESSVKDVENEHKELQDRYDKLVKEDQLIDNGNKRSQALEMDIHKFRTYIKSVEARKIKWGVNLEKMANEVENLKKQQKELENNNQAVVKKLTDHGLNLHDVRNMIDDRKNVVSDHESTLKQLEERSNQLRELEQEARKHFDQLQQIVKLFNLESYSISTMASSEFDHEMDTEIQLENFLDDSKLGMRSDELMSSQGLRTTKKTQLKQFHKLVRDKNYKDKDEMIKFQNAIDLLGEKISERSEFHNNLEAKLASLKIQSEELYNTMALESNSLNAEMEKLEMQLQSLRSNGDNGLIDMDQKIKAKQIELDSVEAEVRERREELHKQVEQIIDGVITFKMDVQESLEDLEKSVSRELERERGNVLG